MVMVKRQLLNEEVDNRDTFPATSRYKGHRYFKREIRRNVLRVEPETWQPPDIEPSATDLQTQVKPGEEGRLDLVARRVYGNEQLWWVIAFINDIIDPFNEVTVGRKLRFPPFDIVATNVLL